MGVWRAGGTAELDPVLLSEFCLVSLTFPESCLSHSQPRPGNLSTGSLVRADSVVFRDRANLVLRSPLVSCVGDRDPVPHSCPQQPEELVPLEF